MARYLTTMSPCTRNLKLYGFNLSDREETARLMLAYTGYKYEDVRVSQKEWEKMKDDMPFAKLPVLEADGQLISHSGAIIRFVAKCCGLACEDDFAEATADMVTEYIFDVMMAFPWFEQDPEKRATKWKEALNVTIPSMLEKLEAILEKSGGEFFAGKLSYADFAIVNAGDYLKSERSEIFDGSPKLKAHVEKILALPNVKEWIAQRPG